MTKTLSYSEAKKFYDRFGKRQDNQPFEEDAIQLTLASGNFEKATAICEFGSGTGLAARQLFNNTLQSTTTYIGIDSSDTMVALARERLKFWQGRATVLKSDGGIRVPLADNSVDRFLSTYVFDLLSEQDIRAVVAEARRVLMPGGLLAVASLTHGTENVERAIEAVWMTGFRIRPKLVGGCRPIDLASFIPPEAGWQYETQETVSQLGFCSEVIVAKKS